MSFLKLQNTSSFKELQLSEPPIDHWSVLHVYTHIQRKKEFIKTGCFQMTLSGSRHYPYNI